jgi:hypothetical protein
MNEGKNLAAEFLIAEFNALQQRAAQIEQSKSNSVNFYLVIVAATLAGMPGLANLVPKQATSIVLSSAFLFIFIVGFLTLDHSINQVVNAIRLYRRAGRIRRYFLDQSYEIQAYLPFEPNDAKPLIAPDFLSLTHRGSEVTVFTINVASLSIFFAILFSAISWSCAILIAALVAVFSWILQNRYFHKKLQQAEQISKQQIHFLGSTK